MLMRAWLPPADCCRGDRAWERVLLVFAEQSESVKSSELSRSASVKDPKPVGPHATSPVPRPEPLKSASSYVSPTPVPFCSPPPTKALLLPKTCCPQHWWRHVFHSNMHSCLLTRLLTHKHALTHTNAVPHISVLLACSPYPLSCFPSIVCLSPSLCDLYNPTTPTPTIASLSCPPCCPWAYCFWQLNINTKPLLKLIKSAYSASCK